MKIAYRKAEQRLFNKTGNQKKKMPVLKAEHVASLYREVQMKKKMIMKGKPMHIIYVDLKNVLGKYLLTHQIHTKLKNCF